MALQPREHPNPLIAAFGALLAFAPELESATAPGDPETLRTRLLDGLIAARDAAVARGVSLAKADSCAWAVAALLDDLALNTPWGGTSAWPRQPLVSTLYGDVDAGARFFDRLEELEAHPNRDPDMLELFYFCLSLGFRGRYRVPGRAGARSLAAVRTSTARLLRDPEAATAPLSPNWQGVAAADEPRQFTVPLWVLFAAAVVAAAGVYFALSLQLSGQSEQLGVLARALPPAERAEIYRPPRDTTRPPAPPAEAADFALVPALEAAAPEGLRPALKGSETVSLATLVVQWTNPEVFRSSQAELTEGFEPLIAALGQAIAENADLIGNVTVVGHTDSIPVGGANPFHDNQGLSEARAATIARILVANGAPPDRVRSEGRAAAEPVASNRTREGRALNRRVEILVEKRL
ncbi:type IVB secretion system protein IcmH/DotU [uncultured Amaricoccus sp.]|uniref:type IVB secretion system protein IcmH/DotU n=1 Tax=uncultured Amaricoccus sp. TaxID=339341 RepID=UPI002604009F|nr:type IVB secretion system protein IcmH/DotU [uncultured Amaricoccus sp.]